MELVTGKTLQEKIKGICGDAILCNADPSETADRILALVSARRSSMLPIKWEGGAAFAAGLFVGHVVDQRPYTERGEYRAWLSTSMDSEPLGYGSKAEAMALVESAIRERLSAYGTNARGGPVMPETPSKKARDFLIKEGWADDCIDPNWSDIRAAMLDEQIERSNSNERYDHADDALHLTNKRDQ